MAPYMAEGLFEVHNLNSVNVRTLDSRVGFQVLLQVLLQLEKLTFTSFAKMPFTDKKFFQNEFFQSEKFETQRASSPG